MEASTPLAGHIDPQAAGLAAAGAVGRGTHAVRRRSPFYFLSFLFAYFSCAWLDTDNSWKIGKVDPRKWGSGS